MTQAKAKPGTERYRDERRSGGGPRMHGRTWHDHEQPHDIEKLSGGGRAGKARAARGGGRGTAMEGADERLGMGKHVGRKDKGAARVNERSPRGKGISRSKSTPSRARSAQRR